jgi:hypothetical protein
LEQITITLGDDMTLGALRAVAQSMGKRLVITLADAAPTRAAARTGSRQGVADTPAQPVPKPKRRRRKLTAEARAALVKNLAKARAVRSANAKAARAKAGKA